MNATPCDCPLAGYCERHQTRKIGRLFEKCRTDQRFFDRWERLLAEESNGNPIDIAKAARRERVKIAVARKKRLISWLHFLRHPVDIGIGDTAHRLSMRPSGSTDAIPLLHELLKQCSCSRDDAVARLNKEHPYKK